jgi:tetratricopeptide (TPR) repeat protein
VHALRGEYDTAIEVCQRALASSHDPVNTAMVTAHLGHAHLEKGDLDRAIPLLEQSASMMSQFRFRPLQGRVLTFLAEGCLATGQLDRAGDLAREGLALTSAAHYAYGLAWAQWILGRIEEGCLFKGPVVVAALVPCVHRRQIHGGAHLTPGRGPRAGRRATRRGASPGSGIFQALRVPHYERKRTSGRTVGALDGQPRRPDLTRARRPPSPV